MNRLPENASELGRKVFAVLDHVYRGIYHMPDSALDRLDFTDAQRISCCVWDEFSTYDFDLLTRLVIAAHDERVRLTIAPATPRLLRLVFHNRTHGLGEGASMWQRHPTIEQAIALCRGEGKRGEPEDESTRKAVL